MRRLVAALVCVIAVACTTANASPGSQRQREPADPTAAAEHYAAVNLLNRTVLWNNVATWNFVVAANYAAAVERAQAEERARAAEAAAAAAIPKQKPNLGSPSPPSGGGGGGSCFGGTPLSDTLVQNESGGRENAYNPSGAWGCFQIMQGTWSGHGCAGSWGSASVEDQKACATTIYNRSGRGQWSASG